MMDTLIVDPHVSDRLIKQRRALGADKYDEVWEGVYVMAPAPNDEHQELSTRVARALLEAIEDTGLGVVRIGINLAIDPENWERDFRVPDVSVFLKNSSAICHGAFWSGSADFLVEIASPWDKTREKIDFYSRADSRELLIVDRDPWQLELLRSDGESLMSVAKVSPRDTSEISSAVLPLRFRLVPGDPRPKIEVFATQLSRTWTV
jgi:hypothetical protein